MKRTIVISEEFGLWKAEASSGAHGTGITPAIAITNLIVSAGGDIEDLEPVAQGAGNRIGDIFNIVVPKREENRDQPASTVR